MGHGLQRKQHLPERGNPLGAKPAAGTMLAWAWEYFEDLRVHHYTPAGVLYRAKSLRVFFRWCGERNLTRVEQVTRPILERYQRWLFYFRKQNGKPLSVSTQYQHISVLRLFFRWLMRSGHLDSNPSSELTLPRLPKRLPQAVLSPEEVEKVLEQPDLSKPEERRDRAMLELLYSTGLRRSELANLKLFDVDGARGTVWVRQGKGKKDRVVPIGERALAWVQKYVEETRPKLALAHDDGFLFIGDAGEFLVPDYFSQLARHYLDRAGIEKPGSCHLFRHSMATSMLDGGADVRFVQEMLGHASLATTQIYTHVSIEKLKAVHAATHPAARLLRSTTAAAGADKKEELEKKGAGERAAELLEELAAEGENDEASVMSGEA